MEFLNRLLERNTQTHVNTHSKKWAVRAEHIQGNVHGALQLLCLTTCVDTGLDTEKRVRQQMVGNLAHNLESQKLRARDGEKLCLLWGPRVMVRNCACFGVPRVMARA